MSKIGQAIAEQPPCMCVCHMNLPSPADFCDDCMENHNLKLV